MECRRRFLCQKVNFLIFGSTYFAIQTLCSALSWILSTYKDALDSCAHDPIVGSWQQASFEGCTSSITVDDMILSVQNGTKHLNAKYFLDGTRRIQMYRDTGNSNMQRYPAIVQFGLALHAHLWCGFSSFACIWSLRDPYSVDLYTSNVKRCLLYAYKWINQEIASAYRITIVTAEKLAKRWKMNFLKTLKSSLLGDHWTDSTDSNVKRLLLIRHNTIIQQKRANYQHKVKIRGKIPPSWTFSLKSEISEWRDPRPPHFSFGVMADTLHCQWKSRLHPFP